MFFFCTCGLDSSLEVSGKLLYSATHIIGHFYASVSTYYLKLKIWRRLSFSSLVMKDQYL